MLLATSRALKSPLSRKLLPLQHLYCRSLVWGRGPLGMKNTPWCKSAVLRGLPRGQRLGAGGDPAARPQPLLTRVAVGKTNPPGFWVIFPF